MTYCNCDLEMFGKHIEGCSKIERPKVQPAEHNQIEIWRAETVKNWTQALSNLAGCSDCDEVIKAIHIKIEQLLGIADDKGGK